MHTASIGSVSFTRAGTRSLCRRSTKSNRILVEPAAASTHHQLLEHLGSISERPTRSEAFWSRFTDARFARQQRDGTRNEPAAEHAVELGDVPNETQCTRGIDLSQQHRLDGFDVGVLPESPRRRLRLFLLQTCIRVHRTVSKWTSFSKIPDGGSVPR